MAELLSIPGQMIGNAAGAMVKATGADGDAAPKVRVVDKPKNSAIIGKYISDKFNKKYGNSLEQANADMLNGFNHVLAKKEVHEKIQETFLRVWMIMATVAINSNEIDFKRKLLEKTVDKIDKYLDVQLSYNTVKKLRHITLIDVFRGGAGKDSISGGAEPSGETPVLTPEMQCFISNRTNELIESYLKQDMEIQTVSDEIVYELQGSIQAHFSDPKIRLEVCSSIDDSVKKMFDSIVDMIVGWGNPLETFYVLLDDTVVQGFIRTIAKKNAKLNELLNEKISDSNTIQKKIQKIFTFLKGVEFAKIKTARIPSALDKVNIRLASLLGGLMKGPAKPEPAKTVNTSTFTSLMNGGSDNLSPADFYLDDIMSNIVDEAYDTINQSPLEPDPINETIQSVVSNSLLDLQLNATSNLTIKEKTESVFRHMFGCIFGLFNEKMKAHFMANHCFTDKRINDVLELKIKDSETKYNESITVLIEPTLFTNTITRSEIVSNPSNESIIFDTRENKPAVNNAMFDRLIAPFYGVMKQESTQKKIQEKMTNRMIGIFANLAAKDIQGSIKNVLVKYIYLPDSMTQMVLTRAKHFAKYKHMNIQSFMTFYLLKKYLYWGRASHQLGLPENPRIVGLTKENRDDYINQFNTTMDNNTNPIQKSQVENLFSTTSRIGRQITRPVDNVASIYGKATEDFGPKAQKLGTFINDKLDNAVTKPLINSTREDIGKRGFDAMKPVQKQPVITRKSISSRNQEQTTPPTTYNQNPKKQQTKKIKDIRVKPADATAVKPAGGKGKRTRRKSRVHCRRTYKIRKSKHC
jgi:hypothetical protein